MGRWASTKGGRFSKIWWTLRLLIYNNLINHKDDQIMEPVTSVTVLDSETNYWCQNQADHGIRFELSLLFLETNSVLLIKIDNINFMLLLNMDNLLLLWNKHACFLGFESTCYIINMYKCSTSLSICVIHTRGGSLKSLAYHCIFRRDGA